VPLPGLSRPRQLLLADGEQPEPVLPLGPEDHVEPPHVEEAVRGKLFDIGAVEEEQVAPLQDLDP